MPRVDEDRRQATHKVELDAIRAAALHVAGQFPEVEAVWLFGSYARGEERRTSDVDFAVMTSHDRCRDFAHRMELAHAFEEILVVPVDAVLLHAQLSLPLLWEALSRPVLLYARDPADAHAFASGLRALVRDHWPRLERRWTRARAWIKEQACAAIVD